ncbi:MAG: cystathionine gamma-lyase [Gemmatimonadota bacterium]
MRDATRIVRAGAPAPEPGAPFLAGPTFASVYHLPGDPTGAPYQYGRYQNPTWTAFEAALEELEGGPTVLFASGMAATYALLQTTLGAGERVVLTGDGYYATRSVAAKHLGARGVDVCTAATEADLLEQLEGTRLVWVETPSNPALTVYDVRRIVEAAHAVGALVAVDNTTPTVGAQKPLALGADFSLASDTKALCGHSDVVLGHVSAADPERAAALRTWRIETGAIPGPMEVWLAHRSLGTLDVRLERMCANAQGVATFLAGRSDVVQVRYPGLATDPSHAVAQRQMSRYGPVVSFELGTAAAAQAFLSAATLVDEATSFGGLHTSGERRARWGGDAVAGGFIRLSLGCEALEDLLEDFEAALAGR